MNTLQIIEKKQDKLSVAVTPNNLDGKLGDLPDPLPDTSGFNMCIIGSPGSGKTNLLYSIMTRKKVKGVRQSYRGLFDHIYVISPTIGAKSMKSDPFSKLPQDQIYKELDMQVLVELEKILEKNRSNDEHSVVIMDDIGSQLRRSQAIDKKLTQLIQNRRHMFCSTIFLVQKYRDLGTGIRSAISHLITFRPKNLPERDAILTEMVPLPLKQSISLLDYVFEQGDQDKYSFLLVDLSLRKSSKYRYFKKFNELNFNI
jgi:nucleoside-triphosphatase THEP1